MANAEDGGEDSIMYATVMYGLGITLLKYYKFLVSGHFYQVENGKRQSRDTVMSITHEVHESKSLDKRGLEIISYATNAFKKVGEKLEDDPSHKRLLSRVLHFLGYCYDKLEKYDDAIKCFKEEMVILDDLRSVEDPTERPKSEQTAETLNFLGGLYVKSNRSVGKAIPILKKAIQIYNKIPKISAKTKVDVYIMLARAYFHEKQYESALAELDIAFRLVRRSIGKGPEEATIENFRGHSYQAMKQYLNSAKGYEKALQIYLDTSEEEADSSHDNILNSLLHLGNVYFEANYFDQALGCYLQVIEMENNRKNESDDESSYSKVALRNIGTIYYKVGAFENAIKYYQKALGKQPPALYASIMTLNNLASSFFQIKAYKEAQKCYSRGAEIGFKLRSDEGSFEEAKCYFNMGLVCEKLYNTEDALQYLKHSRKIFSYLLEDKPETALDQLLLADVYNRLGIIYMKQEIFDHAYGAHYEALQIRRKVHGPHHELVSISCRNIANVCFKQSNFDDAIQFYNIAMESELEPDIRSSILDSLGNVYVKIKDVGKALATFENSMELKKRSNIINSSYSGTLRSIAMLKAQSNPKESENLLKEALEIIFSTSSVIDFRCIRLYVDLAKVTLVIDEGCARRACSYLEQADEMLRIFNKSKRMNDKLKDYLETVWMEAGGRPIRNVMDSNADESKASAKASDVELQND